MRERMCECPQCNGTGIVIEGYNEHDELVRFSEEDWDGFMDKEGYYDMGGVRCPVCGGCGEVPLHWLMSGE